jgi:hypothetical protein
MWAWEQKRVICSFNVRDFYRIYTAWIVDGKSHAGIVLGRQDYSTGDQMRGLLRLATSKSMEEMISRIEFLGQWVDR